jgi:hypothetical protein
MVGDIPTAFHFKDLNALSRQFFFRQIDIVVIASCAKSQDRRMFDEKKGVVNRLFLA